MTKKTLNQNDKYFHEFIDRIEPDFIFSNKPINRFKVIKNSIDNDKTEKLSKLKEQINSIENCNLKNNSKNLVMGDGDINSPIMIVGEAPGNLEDNSGHSFQGEIGILLKKMFSAIKLSYSKVS